MRVGIGFDVHAFATGRELYLGGIKIPFHKGLEGHSDADVLLHAIIDALLGAAALGDIGGHFPPSDPKYKGISSIELLEETARILNRAGFQIGNIDSVIIAEEPKMAPFIKDMRKKIAETLNIAIEQASVKATTTERLGFTGRKEGIAAKAIALIDGTKE